MTYVYSSLPLDILSPEGGYGDLVALTHTRIALQNGNAISEYTGYGFSSNETGIVGGTVTSYSAYFNGILGYTIYGASLSAAWVYQQVGVNNLSAILAEALNGDDIIVGSPYADRLAGYNGDDIIFGGLDNDTIYGGAGNDYIDAGSGQNVIDGGEGTDTAAFASDRASYQFNRGNNNITVAHNLGQEFDTVINVERLQFTDGTLAFDMDGNAGKAYRLYQAAFDRTPDASGLGYWIGVLDDGASLNSVASRFIGSDEFKNLYGHDVSNAQFVDKLYWNILDRAGEEGGKSFWTSELDSGHRSREQVLADFSESNENVVGVAPSINDGIWFV